MQLFVVFVAKFGFKFPPETTAKNNLTKFTSLLYYKYNSMLTGWDSKVWKIVKEFKRKAIQKAQHGIMIASWGAIVGSTA